MSAPDPQEESIQSWLEGIGMGQYAPAFLEHHVSFEMLPAMTDADLKDLGVAALGHRKLLLNAITERKTKTTGGASAPPMPAKLGHFELLEPMGRGGMGMVYRAWDSSLNRQVAVKVLDRDVMVSDPQFMEDFLREARSAASINHPNIVQIYFAGEENGICFIAMELLEGQDVSARLERGPMDEKAVLRIARQIIEALAATYARRIIHGDIKPHNIFLTKTGGVKLLDFGLARKKSARTAETGYIVGSADYISPERVRSEPEDFRSDIYSLGATLFEAIAGLAPFEGETASDVAQKRLVEDAPLLRSVKPGASPQLEAMIAHMLARDVQSRPASYEALLAELTAVESAGLGFDPEKKLAFSLPGAAPQTVAARVPTGATGMIPPGARSQTGVMAAPGQSFPAAAYEHHEPPKPTLWQRFTNNRFLFISVVAHVLFGLIAAALVVQTITAKRKLTFTAAPPSPNPSTRSLEHKVQMAKKQNTMSAPAQAKRITTAGVAKVSLPEMPAMPAMNTATTSKMGGMGGTSLGLGPSAGALGTGGGAGGGPMLFGLRGGAGLAGTFYDLKQTRDGKPTNMAIVDQNWKSPKEEGPNKQYRSELTSFIRNGMSEGALSKYFRGPTTLYSTQFYIPVIAADEAPKAFQVEQKVKPRRWLIVYRGKVTPPESGTFRFVGSADDVLVVRFSGKVVLDAGCNGPGAKFEPVSDFKHKTPKRLPGTSGVMGNAWEGDTFDVRAGTAYPLEVVIGEWPGGECAFFLLLEKMGGSGENLPVFKLAPSEVKGGQKYMPKFGPDTPWSVWKSEATKSLFGS